MKHLKALIFAIVSSFALATCGGSPVAPVPVLTTTTSALNPVLVSAEYLIGAGDIGHCRYMDSARTAALLDEMEGTVITIGDNAYESGKAEEFAQCYEPTWGRFKPRTRAGVGNHDYYLPGAFGYFDYFGPAAGVERTGYYSYDLGSWHILSLNTSVNARTGSAQWNWVREDLARNQKPCTLAYWHYPLFNSGYDGNMPHMRDVWDLLYQAKAEVVLSGHAHHYERFAPMDALGRSDPRGIRELIVGTGGAPLTEFVARQPNSEVFNNQTFGVIRMTLRADGYDWQFVPVEGSTFGDVGSGSCF